MATLDERNQKERAESLRQSVKDLQAVLRNPKGVQRVLRIPKREFVNSAS